MPPTCVGIGASLDLVSKGGKRSLLAEEFLQSPLETARRDDEIVVAITLPAPPKSCGSAYKKWGLVTDSLPVVGVCAFIGISDDGRCHLARLAVGGLATGPRRAKAGENALIGISATDVSAISDAAEAAAASTETQSDMWADAEYRKKLIGTLACEVITSAFARAAPEKHP
jgi:aerobic carbon-monoxide dehydrogenase medium subunit